MNCNKEDMLLYAVTDRHWLGENSLADAVEKALQGGATFVQLREKETDHAAIVEEALAIRGLCRRYGVPFVIDDDVKLALEVDADGVHVGQSDMEAGNVRAMLGPDKIIGVTARTVEQALLAQSRGADYLGCGAVFATGSKADARPLDHAVLKEICSAVNIPVVAIGGIDASNVSQLAGCGVDGVAVISGIFAQKDITAAAAQLKELTSEMIRKKELP